jgi:hypothetical protein
MQLVLEGRAFGAWFKPGPGPAEQAAADPLWQLHSQLSQALLLAAPPRLDDAAAFGPEGLQEVKQIEQTVSSISVCPCRLSCVLFWVCCWQAYEIAGPLQASRCVLVSVLMCVCVLLLLMVSTRACVVLLCPCAADARHCNAP